MTTRTSQTVVTFAHTFALPDIDATLPAGRYRVEIDEERIEGVSYPAYRRVRTLFFYRANGAPAGLETMLAIAPAALDAALRRDATAVSDAGAQPSTTGPERC